MIVDDGAGLSPVGKVCDIPITIYRAPWRLGVATAFNFGVALSPTDCVFMLGSDDYLEPECLETCLWAFERDNETRWLSYYWVPVHYLDERPEPDQFLPCNAAMVTKQFWRYVGGFPYEAFTAPDAALVSIMLSHGEKAGYLKQVGTKPLYNYRPHDGTDTAKRGAWQGIILGIRHLVSQEWKPKPL